MRKSSLFSSLLLSLSILISLAGFYQPLQVAAAAPAEPLVPVLASPAGSLALTTSAGQVSGGSNHTCALTSDGGVVCWGFNSSGQVGDGTRLQRNSPVAVSGLTSGVLSVVSGHLHSCALTSGGGVKCWGANFYGQLGDGGGGTATTPVDVQGLTSGVIAIAAGSDHTCAVTSGGAVKCWGFNNAGQLGDGTTANAFAPVDVSGLGSGASGIGAGGQHSCARLASGGAKCWGANDGGQLGNGSTTASGVPVTVNVLSDVLTSIDGGEEHTCALTAAGAAYCWGRNSNGRLGDSSYSDKTSPVQPFSMGGFVTSISAGGQHTCSVYNGAAMCWGGNNNGQLGNNSTGGSNIAVAVSGLGSGVASISAGEGHTCAVLDGGSLNCWGFNLYGQLGDSTSGLYFTPVAVYGLATGMSAVSAGESHTCARSTSGGLKCWGTNNLGQLGNNTNVPSNIPVDVNGLASGAAAVSAGLSHTCGLTSGGGVKCWGYNGSGQLGSGNYSNSLFPVDVSGLGSGISQISSGGEHTCALTGTGTVKCWGYNGDGQLGNGNTNVSNIPVDVSGLPGAVSRVSAGYSHTCVLTAAGGVYCWGDNAIGQLGIGTTDDSLTPVMVSGLGSGVVDLSVGAEHTCAVLNGGGIKCWGKNYSGQAGADGGGSKTTPVDVGGLGGNATSVDAGNGHSCAIVSGGLKCWGTNTDGQLGDGTGQSSYIPVGVSGLSSGVLQVSAGSSQTCAVVNSSAISCWGSSDDGEVGNGIPIKRLGPVSVSGFGGSYQLYLPALRKG